MKQLLLFCSNFTNLIGIKSAIFLFALVFLFSSCTTIVFMNRTVPPRMDLEKSPARIVFNNHFNFQDNAEIKEKHEDAYKLGIDEFAKTLVNIIPPNIPMAVFLYDSSSNYRNTDVLYDTLPLKNEIISLCATNNADFLLSLDSLNFYFDWDVEREENSDGSVSKTKNFHLFCSYYLTLYDFKGMVKQKTCVEKSCYYSSRPTLGSLITIKPNLDNARQNIQRLANDAGQEYISLFYPSIENNVIRKLYAGKVFKETNTLIKSHRYNEAIRLLNDLLYTVKPKLVAKAQHNLDIANELKQNNIKTFIAN